jgi:hypothetical protein
MSSLGDNDPTPVQPVRRPRRVTGSGPGEFGWPAAAVEIVRVVCLAGGALTLTALKVIPWEWGLAVLAGPAFPGVVGLLQRARKP